MTLSYTPCRIDLEKIRTIADQIRRREKIKRRMVMTWRSSWQHKLALAGQHMQKVTKKKPQQQVFASIQNHKAFSAYKLTTFVVPGSSPLCLSCCWAKYLKVDICKLR